MRKFKSCMANGFFYRQMATLLLGCWAVKIKVAQRKTNLVISRVFLLSFMAQFYLALTYLMIIPNDFKNCNKIITISDNFPCQ